MNQDSIETIENEELVKIRQGTYSDILFVLLPFMAILLQRMWTGEMGKILLGYELSTASAILGGLSISKFIQGLVSHPALNVKKDRLVFTISLTLFCVVVPSLVLAMKLASTDDVPGVIAYIQPVLMVIAISLYISAIRIVKSFDDPSADTFLSQRQEGSAESQSYSLSQMMNEENRHEAKG